MVDALEEPGAGLVDSCLDGVTAGVGDLDDGVALGDAGAPEDFAVGEVAFGVEVAGVAGVVDAAEADGELEAVAVGPGGGGFAGFEVEADAEAGAGGGGEVEEEALGFALGEGVDAILLRLDLGFGACSIDPICFFSNSFCMISWRYIDTLSSSSAFLFLE